MVKKILIVEDEYDIGSTMELALEMEGYEVRLTSNGHEARDVLNSEALPALIICDIMMPLMDGYEFTRQLRAESRYQHIPLILSSAAQLHTTKLPENSYQGFLRKPFDLDEFTEMVKLTLQK